MASLVRWYARDYAGSNPAVTSTSGKYMKACKQIWEDLPWFLKPVRYASQLVAFGTDCPCCLGFRVWVGLILGIIIGYSLG